VCGILLTMPHTLHNARATLLRGLRAGLHTTWILGKIIFPITLVLVILQHTPVLPWVIRQVSPLMQVIGLRGETAIPLVLGVALNLYAAIAAILTLSLTVKEVFILAVLLSFAHNMFVEAGVALKVGVRLWVILLVRFGLGIMWAVLIHLAWPGGGEIARYSMVPAASAVPHGWAEIAVLAVTKAVTGTLQVAIIVIPLMLIIQVLKERRLLQKFSAKVGRFTCVIGVQPNAALTLVAGFFTGLAYGAGIMIQAVEEDGVSRRDATLAIIFLMCSHAVVEDTLLFVPLGISVWPLLALRIATALAVTAGAAALWKPRPELAGTRQA